MEKVAAARAGARIDETGRESVVFQIETRKAEGRKDEAI
jgi:hypothetical protein